MTLWLCNIANTFTNWLKRELDIKSIKLNKQPVVLNLRSKILQFQLIAFLFKMFMALSTEKAKKQ